MKEGAWISLLDGRWSWVHDHAVWILHPGNSALLGIEALPPTRLLAHRYAPNPDTRREVLLWAMGKGLMRVRGHGVVTSFEFTAPLEEALRAAQPFMRAHFGAYMACRFNNVTSGESCCGLFRDLDHLAGRLPAEEGLVAGQIHPHAPGRG